MENKEYEQERQMGKNNVEKARLPRGKLESLFGEDKDDRVRAAQETAYKLGLKGGEENGW